jgi:hypothetical protein
MSNVDDLFVGVSGSIGVTATEPIFLAELYDLQSGQLFDLRTSWDVLRPPSPVKATPAPSAPASPTDRSVHVSSLKEEGFVILELRSPDDPPGTQYVITRQPKAGILTEPPGFMSTGDVYFFPLASASSATEDSIQYRRIINGRPEEPRVVKLTLSEAVKATVADTKRFALTAASTKTVFDGPESVAGEVERLAAYSSSIGVMSASAGKLEELAAVRIEAETKWPLTAIQWESSESVRIRSLRFLSRTDERGYPAHIHREKRQPSEQVPLFDYDRPGETVIELELSQNIESFAGKDSKLDFGLLLFPEYSSAKDATLIQLDSPALGKAINGVQKFRFVLPAAISERAMTPDSVLNLVIAPHVSSNRLLIASFRWDSSRRTFGPSRQIRLTQLPKPDERFWIALEHSIMRNGVATEVNPKLKEK